jgi:hypothetical protein
MLQMMAAPQYGLLVLQAARAVVQPAWVVRLQTVLTQALLAELK